MVELMFELKTREAHTGLTSEISVIEAGYANSKVVSPVYDTDQVS